MAYNKMCGPVKQSTSAPAAPVKKDLRTSVTNSSVGSIHTSDLKGRVHEDYTKNWCGIAEDPQAPIRSQSSMESHFPRLKLLLKRWNTFYNKAKARASSGTNLVDVNTQAQALYFGKTGKTFDKWDCREAVKTHDHFKEVVDSPTPFDWNFPISPERETDSPIDLGDSEDLITPRSNQKSPLPSSPVRPMGVKAANEAKKKGKKATYDNNDKTITVFHNMECTQKTLLEANIKRDEETLQLARESLEIEKKKEERCREAFELEKKKEQKLARQDALADMAEETRIMTMDTSQFTHNTEKWYKRRKDSIMKDVDESTSASGDYDSGWDFGF